MLVMNGENQAGTLAVIKNVFDQKKTLICPQFSFTNYRMKYYTFLESAYTVIMIF